MGKYGIPFDYFSLPVRGFNIKGHESSKSWFGFIGTIIFFGIVFAVFIAEFVKMINREDLAVSIAEVGVPIPPPTNVGSLIMAFAVANIASNTPFVENVDYNIQAELWSLTFPNNIPTQTFQPLAIQKCDEEYFGDLADQIMSLTNIQNAFCIPRNQNEDLFTLEGQLGSKVFRAIRVSIRCGMVGDTACPSSFISSSITFMSGSSYLDVSNYEQPIQITPTIIRDYADKVSYHEKTILITPREIITDKGFLFSSEESQSDLIVSEGPNRVQGLNLNTPDVFNFRIMLNPSKIIVKRQYSKILDVLASSTGIASTIALFAGYFLRKYLEERTHSEIMKTLGPGTYKSVTLRDYIKAVMGNKIARQKIKSIKDEKDWVTQNLDIVKMIKNWNDFDRVKKAVLIDDETQAQMQLQGQDSSPLALTFEKHRSFLNSSCNAIDLVRVHPK